MLHTIFFSHHLKKKSPRDKKQESKSKDGCTQVPKDFEHQHKNKESPATEASLGWLHLNLAWKWGMQLNLDHSNHPHLLPETQTIELGLSLVWRHDHQTIFVSWASAVRLARSMWRSLLIKMSSFKRKNPMAIAGGPACEALFCSGKWGRGEWAAAGALIEPGVPSLLVSSQTQHQ